MIKNKSTLEESRGTRVTSQGLLTYAGKFYKTFFVIIDHRHDFTTEYYPVTYYLASHSIELALKSILRKDYDLGKLINFGHDLNRLANHVNKKYLPLTKKEMAIIEALNPLYKDKQFEYILVGSKNLPNESEINMVCDSIIQKAANFLKK